MCKQNTIGIVPEGKRISPKAKLRMPEAKRKEFSYEEYTYGTAWTVFARRFCIYFMHMHGKR